MNDDATEAGSPSSEKVQAVKLFEVPNYCEGPVFDHDGFGYISHGEVITQFNIDGQRKTWATTGAPNGHKILSDGTHLVCDAGQNAVLLLDKNGHLLGAASWVCDGKPLRGPNDLTLDPQGGFYFTDPIGSNAEKPTGTVHYVDPQQTTHLVVQGLAYPNGIVLVPGGKRLLVAESSRNRVIEYPVLEPGKVGEMKVFANLPSKQGEQIKNMPDGMCLDAKGNLYVAHYGMRQVQQLDPQGKLIASYPGGNLTTSNVAFGGPRMDQLYVTGGIGEEAGVGGLFRIDLGVKGLVILPEKK